MQSAAPRGVRTPTPPQRTAAELACCARHSLRVRPRLAEYSASYLTAFELDALVARLLKGAAVQQACCTRQSPCRAAPSLALRELCLL